MLFENLYSFPYYTYTLTWIMFIVAKKTQALVASITGKTLKIPSREAVVIPYWLKIPDIK